MYELIHIRDELVLLRHVLPSDFIANDEATDTHCSLAGCSADGEFVGVLPLVPLAGPRERAGGAAGWLHWSGSLGGNVRSATGCHNGGIQKEERKQLVAEPCSGRKLVRGALVCVWFDGKMGEGNLVQWTSPAGAAGGRVVLLRCEVVTGFS